MAWVLPSMLLPIGGPPLPPNSSSTPSPHPQSFSSVVGPNGSGKSNVIDAMLFVFGKRAKALRLNKVSELIHNSAGRQGIQQAQVSVRFQEIIDLVREAAGREGRFQAAREGRNPSVAAPARLRRRFGRGTVGFEPRGPRQARAHSRASPPLAPTPLLQEGDAYEPVPGTEFVVSRTAHRSNKSDYFVDGKKSSFSEVTALLKGKGIDLDNNRFLILQGEVEQISMMKPKAATEHDTGLLEYLEDIIGTNKYIEPLAERAKRYACVLPGGGELVSAGVTADLFPCPLPFP